MMLSKIKEKCIENALLTYPNYELPFYIHTDSSEYQMGGIISQKKKVIIFTDKEKEALVKCLAEYKDPFKGQVENLEGIQVKFELKKGVEPFHAKPYSVPIAHLSPLKQVIQEMVKIRSLYHPQKIQNGQHQHFVCPRKIREFM